MDVVRNEVIPYQWDALNDRIPNAEPSHAIKNLRIAAGEEQGEFYGMVFQDSDVAKWLEAVAYSLENHPDTHLEETADELINLLGRAQQEDGYLNTYYTIKEPNNRWTNLRDNHELYCAGHFIEAAVSYYKATGKRKFLDIMIKYTDYIISVFGTEEGKIPGYPGHQEIELALIKLFDVTGEEKYLKLSKYFIDQRGEQPHYFEIEEREREDKQPFFFTMVMNIIKHTYRSGNRIKQLVMQYEQSICILQWQPLHERQMMQLLNRLVRNCGIMLLSSRCISLQEWVRVNLVNRFHLITIYRMMRVIRKPVPVLL